MGPWLLSTKRNINFPRGTTIKYKEGQKHACPEQIKEKCACLCYSHNTKDGKAGLTKYQISVLAKHAEKHRDRPHARALLWLHSQHHQNAEHGDSSSKALQLEGEAASSQTLQESVSVRGRKAWRKTKRGHYSMQWNVAIAVGELCLLPFARGRACLQPPAWGVQGPGLPLAAVTASESSWSSFCREDV